MSTINHYLIIKLLIGKQKLNKNLMKSILAIFDGTFLK
jgi:hypothetical protein